MVLRILNFFYGFVVAAGCRKKNTSLSAPFLGQAQKIVYSICNCSKTVAFFFSQLTTRRGAKRSRVHPPKMGRNGTVEGRSRFFFLSGASAMTVMLPMGITTLCLAGADLEQLDGNQKSGDFNHRLDAYKTPINNEINYQPQLVNAGFLPSTEFISSETSWAESWRIGPSAMLRSIATVRRDLTSCAIET